MPRPSLWLPLVVLLLGILFLREPSLQRSEDNFLRWLLRNSSPRRAAVPLTVVEIGRDPLLDSGEKPSSTTPVLKSAAASAVSPLEYALFLQSALAFQPTVVAFENVLIWRDRDKDQEQVFIDQAMRVPRLLLAAELTAQPESDAPGAEVVGFANVTGKRTDLTEYSGVARQPNEDLRLISTAGFVNLPEEDDDELRVPLLFQYRGEVIPSFSLQAILLWLRVTPSEVKIEVGKEISLPQNRRIPIRSDGTIIVNPSALKNAHRLGLNELLLAAQQRDTGSKPTVIDSLRDQIVLARTPTNPLSPPDVFAATIATLQSNRYVRRIHWLFDCLILLAVAAAAPFFRRVPRVDLVLGAIAFTAAYCLIAFSLVSNAQIWLPGILPLGSLWLAVLLSCFTRRSPALRSAGATAVPPPVV